MNLQLNSVAKERILQQEKYSIGKLTERNSDCLSKLWSIRAGERMESGRTLEENKPRSDC